MISSLPWPLTGRDAELRRVAEAIEDPAVRGIVLSGGPGLGKSRLAHEALAAQERAGAFTVWAQATLSAAAVPLGAFAGLLPDDARSDDLLALMRGAAATLLQRANGRPVVVGVDDAQRLDPVSAALVLHLATVGMFVLVTVRTGEPCPDAIVALWKDGHAELLELDRLSEPAVAQLVESALGGPLDETALHWVRESSQGNPLYVRELVASAIESESLTRSRGLWWLSRRPQVRASLRQLIAARMADLSAEQRAPIELLALVEPLRLPEIASLTSYDALEEAEARALVVMESVAGTDEVRLAHPLFGDVVGAAPPRMRARRLSEQLASTLERRQPFTGDDALRLARLSIDAGTRIPDTVQLIAARAANMAGDPDLAAQLAERSLAGGGGLDATMVLAHAHTLRRRASDAESALARAEPLAPGHPQALQYLEQRVHVLYFGLRSREAAMALLERAMSWSADADWQARVRGTQRFFEGVFGGFGSAVAISEALASPDLSAEARYWFEALHAISLLYAGDGTQASAVARRIRPGIPLRHAADPARLGGSALIPIETGVDWPELEDFMSRTMRDAVRVGDEEAAGMAALALGSLHFMRGRFVDARRWLLEADLHYARHDTFGHRVHVNSYLVGLSVVTREFDDAAEYMSRMREVLAGHDPLPSQLPYIVRAEGWMLRATSDTLAGKTMLEQAAAAEQTPVFATRLAYEALRAGANATAVMAPLAQRCDAPLVTAYVAHARARSDRDPVALSRAAGMFEDIGALRFAMEATAEAAAMFLNLGQRDSSRRTASRARALHQVDQGADPPQVDGLDGPAIELTARETQIVELARSGMTSPDIAERLVLSVRTVESHLYRAMSKLGVRDRRDL